LVDFERWPLDEFAPMWRASFEAGVGTFGVGAVEPLRRRGIGGAMMSWLLQRAFTSGVTFAPLNPNNDAAERVYARPGFAGTAGLDVYVDL
jgi:GNAT superfamily N-acetyltransferase